MTAWQDMVNKVIASRGTVGGGPTTLPGNVDGDAALQIQLKMLEKQQKALQAQLSSANAKLKVLKAKKKPTAKDKRLIAMQEATVKRLDANLKATTLKLSTTQNKYYEKTGQYEKLLTGENRDAFMALNSLFS